jgi:uncharacterized protein (TIGR02246 family)
MKREITIAIMAIAAVLAACVSKRNTASRETAAREAIAQLWQALQTHDLELLDGLVADDPDIVLFGTDAAERWVGHDAFMAAVEQMAAAFDVERLSVRDEVVRIHESGEVACFSGVIDADASAGGKVIQVRGVRVTGVFEYRDNTWRLVQYHSSVPVAGQSVAY